VNDTSLKLCEHTHTERQYIILYYIARARGWCARAHACSLKLVRVHFWPFRFTKLINKWRYISVGNEEEIYILAISYILIKFRWCDINGICLFMERSLWRLKEVKSLDSTHNTGLAMNFDPVN